MRVIYCMNFVFEPRSLVFWVRNTRSQTLETDALAHWASPASSRFLLNDKQCNNKYNMYNKKSFVGRLQKSTLFGQVGSYIRLKLLWLLIMPLKKLIFREQKFFFIFCYFVKLNTKLYKLKTKTKLHRYDLKKQRCFAQVCRLSY